MDALFGEHLSTPLDDDAVLAAYPWPEGRRWVRAMMVTTLDGAAAGPDGLSGSISSDADKAVFRAVRRRADAVLVGSGTIRAEHYGPMRPFDGDDHAPRLAVVSASLDLPWDDDVWSRSEHQPLVLTQPGADDDALARARSNADVAVLDDLQPATLLDALAERDLLHVVCEGGPSLLRGLVAADLVDEAAITVSPTFAGTEHTPSTDALPDVARFRLVHVLHGDDFLMCRHLAPGR